MSFGLSFLASLHFFQDDLISSRLLTINSTQLCHLLEFLPDSADLTVSAGKCLRGALHTRPSRISLSVILVFSEALKSEMIQTKIVWLESGYFIAQKTIVRSQLYFI